MTSLESNPKFKKQIDHSELELSSEKMKEIKDILESRFTQNRSSRLAEYITGLRPEDPKMMERLLEDQKIIRIKYNLPADEHKYKNISEYETFLLELAQKHGTSIRSKSELGNYFDEHTMAGAVHIGENNTIGMDFKKETIREYVSTLGSLEHELIHVMQDERYPGMPIELMEYEAYIADFNGKYFKEYPEHLDWMMFGFFIGGSVAHYYENENQHWDTPEYFLEHVDHIDKKYIEEYKQTMSEKKTEDVAIVS